MINIVGWAFLSWLFFGRDAELKWALAFIIAISVACGKDEIGGKEGAEDEDPYAETMAKGQDGADGQDGEDGKTTVEVKDIGERPLELNQWQDPITAKIWLIGPKGKWDELSYCTGDYTAPDQLTLMQAVMHGLFTVSNSLGGPVTGWTNEEYSLTQARLINTSALQPYADFQGKGLAHGIFCVKKDEVIE